MKNYYSLIILLLSALFFYNCSEENPIENNYNKYNGTWIWIRTVGGLFPRIISPNEGMTIKISFDNLGKFKTFRNDSLKVSANYIIEKSENTMDKISYVNVSTYEFYFNAEPDYAELKTDTLILWDGMMDGYFSFYKKIL